MLAELATGMLLLWIRPTGVTLPLAVAGAALLGVVWLSTQLVQVPCHARLSQASPRRTLLEIARLSAGARFLGRQ